MAKITKQELNQMIKEEVRKQTSRNRRRIFESNAGDFKGVGNILVKYIGKDSKVIIPNNIIRIKEHAFDRCYNVKSITIPNSVTSIGSWAFGSCTGLTSIKIPNSVKEISNHAFFNCINLTDIQIPKRFKNAETLYNMGFRAEQIELLVDDCPWY